MPVIVKEMGAKGRGLVATKDMEMGTLIMKENAAVNVSTGFRAAMGEEAFGREIERQMSNLSNEEQDEFYKLTKKKKTMMDPSVPEKYKEVIAIFENNRILSTESKSQSTDYIVTFKVTCGTGTRRRGRVCSGSSHGGRPCAGEESQAEVCNEAPCPGFFYIKRVKM